MNDMLNLYIVQTHCSIKSPSGLTGATQTITEVYHILASDNHFARAWIAARVGNGSYCTRYQTTRSDVTIGNIEEVQIAAVIHDGSLKSVLGM